MRPRASLRPPACLSQVNPLSLFLYRSKYYEKDSLVADPDYGSILSSLLGELVVHSVRVEVDISVQNFPRDFYIWIRTGFRQPE